MARAMINVVDLVSGRVGEKVFFPDREPIPAAQDFVEAQAFASILCSSPASAAALLRWADAEAEAIIRQNFGAVKLLATELAEVGVLDADRIDSIIASAVDAEKLKAERERRADMQARAASAAKFKELTANGLVLAAKLGDL